MVWRQPRETLHPTHSECCEHRLRKQTASFAPLKSPHINNCVCLHSGCNFPTWERGGSGREIHGSLKVLKRIPTHAHLPLFPASKGFDGFPRQRKQKNGRQMCSKNSTTLLRPHQNAPISITRSQRSAEQDGTDRSSYGVSGSIR